MGSLFLLSLAIAPPILVVYYIRKADFYDKEPLDKLLKAFLFGILSTVPSYIILNYVTMPLLDNAFTQAFIGVGLVEEFFKFIFLYFIFYKDKDFDEPLDGIVYALSISMGFAAAENFVYVFDWYEEIGFETAFIRMFTAIPAHATFGVVMGYVIGHGKFLRNDSELKFLGLKFNSKNENDYLILSLVSAAFFHGVYDYFLFLNIPGFQIFSYIFLAIAINFSFKAIKIHQENSPYNKNKKGKKPYLLRGNPFIDYFINILKFKYFDFNGRARRSELWYFLLFNIIISIIVRILDFVIFGYDFDNQNPPLTNLFTLVTYLPTLALYVRRLHDVGKSGWWLLISLTGIGIFYLIYLFICDSEKGKNQYGDNPKIIPRENKEELDNDKQEKEENNKEQEVKETKKSKKMVFTRSGWEKKE